MSEPVWMEASSDAVTIWLDRPEVRNALSFRSIELLERICAGWETDPPDRTVVVRGRGRWFGSGGDLREFVSLSGAQAAEMAGRMQRVLRTIEDLPVVTVAALDGPAIGGGAEFCLACDLRVASDRAYLRFAQSLLGITTGWEGSERLYRMVGYASALDVLVTGRPVTGTEAREIGLVNQVWPVDEFDQRLNELLAAIARRSAAREVKALLRDIERGRGGAERETAVFARLWDVQERRRAMERALGGRIDEKAPRTG